MHHIIAVLLAAAPAPTAAAAATAEEFYASLQAPVSFEGLAVDVAANDLEIRFSLRELGPVSVVVHVEDEGDGRGLVTVGGAVVAEVGFVDGDLAWEKGDFSGLSPVQAHAAAASIVQVWQEEVVTAALNRWSLKCTWVGQIAGATIGVAVFAGCGLVSKNPGCYGHGLAAQKAVGGYITNKCKGAQNK
jgi:hypothetical protein